jgi:hypothetical protein
MIPIYKNTTAKENWLPILRLTYFPNNPPIVLVITFTLLPTV